MFGDLTFEYFNQYPKVMPLFFPQAFVNSGILTWASAKEPKVTKAKPRNLGGFWVVKVLVLGGG